MASSENICLLGGSGFVGTELATQLGNRGKSVRVLSRDVRHLRALRVVPSLNISEVNPYNTDELTGALEGQDTLINLVGILNESVGRGGTFQAAHVDLCENLITAARQSGVRRIIQIGALNADAENGPSEYLRSKGKAADMLLASGLDVTIVCPSVIFGNGDGLFGRFANLLHAVPMMPLACADTRFAPVYVGDVARAICEAIDNPETRDQTLNLCGPDIFTLREIVEYTAETLELRRRIFDLPDVLAKFQGFVMEFVPGKPFSRDNFNSMQVDSVCEDCEPQPTPVHKIVPTYLGKNNRQSRLQRYRQFARRSSDEVRLSQPD